MNQPVYDTPLEQLGPNEDRARLCADLAAVQRGQGIREAVIQGFVELLDAEQRLGYESFARLFPRRALFSMQPFDEFLLKLVRIASLREPGRGWYAAASGMVEAVVAGDFLERNPIARPLLQACDRDMGEFLRVFVSARGAVLSFGEVVLEERSARHTRVTFHASCAGALSWPFPRGFYGVMKYLGCDGRVEIVECDNSSGVLELDVAWSPSTRR